MLLETSSYNLQVEDINLFIKLSLLLVVLGFIRRLKKWRGHGRKLCIRLHNDLVLLWPPPVASCVLLIERGELGRFLIVLFFPTRLALVTLAFALRVFGFFRLLLLLLLVLVLPLVDEIPSLSRLAARLLLRGFLCLSRRSLRPILGLLTLFLRLTLRLGISLGLLARLLLLGLLLFGLSGFRLCLAFPPVDKLGLRLSLTTSFLFLLYWRKIFLDLFL